MTIRRASKGDFVVTERNRTSVFSRTRALDFGLGAFKIAIGVGYWITGDPINPGPDGSITHGWPAWVWITLLLGLGLTRRTALIVNGRFRQSWSAIVRAGAALLGGLFWLGIAAVAVNVPSLLLFLSLAIAEGWCGLRAVRDAVLIWLDRKGQLVDVGPTP